MSDYARKITPICCHAYRVNRVWEEAENRWVNRLTIEPQTFCGLKEIELKTRKIQRRNQQCVTITQSRLANFYCSQNTLIEQSFLLLGLASVHIIGVWISKDLYCSHTL